MHHRWKDAFISFQIHTFFALGFGFTEEEKEKEGNWKQAASHSLTWLSLSSSPTICLCTVHLTLHCIRKWTFKCKWIHVSWRTSQIFFRGYHLLFRVQRPSLVFKLGRSPLTMWIAQCTSDINHRKAINPLVQWSWLGWTRRARIRATPGDSLQFTIS